MATTEQARNEVLGLLERLKQDSDALAKALQAFVGEAGQPRAEPSEEKAPLTDREAFLRMKDKLLTEYRDMWVAFANGGLVAAAGSLDDLLPATQAIEPAVDVYVEHVEEKAFLDPPEFDCPEIEVFPGDTESRP